MTGRVVRLGTRASALARAQADSVAAALRSVFPDLQTEIVLIKTLGDQRRDRALHELGAAGVFVKELENALQAGEIDVAVHSAKDLPSDRPPDLTLAAFPPREDCRDALVLRSDGESGRATGAPELDLEALARYLPAGSRIGTGSVRRRAVLMHHCPNLAVMPLRGNVDTRLAKLAAGEYDALVLAAAGLIRLGLQEQLTCYLNPRQVIPAVAQGALALEVRTSDRGLIDYLRRINDTTAEICARAERGFLKMLGGDCAVPLGALARWDGNHLAIDGFVAGTEGESYLADRVDDSSVSDAAGAEAAGSLLGQKLLDAGARDVLGRRRPR